MATPGVGVTTSTRTPAKVPGRVGSEEYHTATLPSSQEAALLYAANMAEAAQRLLKAEIKDPVGRANKQAWLMLFDLFQIAQNREEYDSISMLFTVKFEQSPPAWTDGEGTAADPRRTQSRERKDYFALKPGPTGELAEEIEKFRVFTEEQGTVRFDVAKVTALRPSDAKLLAETLQGLRKKNVPMWFNHIESLEKVLRAAFNEKATEAQRPYWMLLFELYILLNKPTEFEELSLEYAVAFEMSPPNWETYVNSIAAAAKSGPSKPVAVPSAPPESGFPLKGVLSAASANQLAELNAHAASRSEVTIDMSKVLRIDFPFTANFFEAVKAMQVAGKRVILANLNELNAALLEALGVNRFAILVRRKSH